MVLIGYIVLLRWKKGRMEESGCLYRIKARSLQFRVRKKLTGKEERFKDQRRRGNKDQK